MIRIAICDDHQLVLDGIKSLLKDLPDFEFVFEANNGKKLLEYLEVVSVDIVLLDLNMPEMDGCTTLENLRGKGSEQKVLVLTMENDKPTIQKAINAGADGYVLKNADQSILEEAIKKVVAGERYFSSDVTMTLLNGGPQKTEDKKCTISTDTPLTDRETDILKLIAEGFSNKEIGEKLFISHRTVDTHRTNLMKKLEVHNVAGLIRYALQSGIAE